MIKASELKGRAVVSLADAQKIGAVSAVIFDPEAGRVTGLKLNDGSAGGFVRVEDIRSIGPDAVTLPDATVLHDAQGGPVSLDGQPDSRELSGTKVVSENGTLLGTIDDVQLDEQTLRIAGYKLAGSLWQQMMGENQILPAQQGFRYGGDLLIVPDSVAAALQQGQQPADVDSASAAHQPATNGEIYTPNSQAPSYDDSSRR